MSELVDTYQMVAEIAKLKEKVEQKNEIIEKQKKVIKKQSELTTRLTKENIELKIKPERKSHDNVVRAQ